MEGGISETSSSGIAVKETPVKKLLAVKTCRSLGSFNNEHKDLDVKEASVCDNNVQNSSSVKN